MNKRGQSTMEYVLIAVLVILGIVIMGPYVLRSIGAHFKLWDEDVQDSYTEHITQAPLNDVPDMPLNCKCTDTPRSCGGSCGPDQRMYIHTCSLPGCDGQPDYHCNADPTCCTDWESIGCGSVPCPPGGCSGAPTSPMPEPNNCYFGQRIQIQKCASPVAYRCIVDSTCLPACLGTITTAATACPNSPGTCSSCPLLTKNQNINFVPNQHACTAGTPCQYYCSPGYTLDYLTCTCVEGVSGCVAHFVGNAKSISSHDNNWSTFMVDHAIWVTPVAPNIQIVGQKNTYTRTFNIPNGSYKVKIAIDDTGGISINGNNYSVRGNSDGYDTFGPFTLPGGPTTIILYATEKPYFPNVTWSHDQAGVAMQLFDSSDPTKVVAETSYRSEAEANKWQVSVDCDAGTQWVCSGSNAFSCQTTSPSCTQTK